MSLDDKACEVANQLTEHARPYKAAAWAIESAAHNLRLARVGRAENSAEVTYCARALTEAIDAGKNLLTGYPIRRVS